IYLGFYSIVFKPPLNQFTPLLCIRVSDIDNIVESPENCGIKQMLMVGSRNQKYIRRHIIEILEQRRNDTLQFAHLMTVITFLGDGIKLVQKKDDALISYAGEYLP